MWNLLTGALMAALGIAIVACATPAISDIGQDKVKVVASGNDQAAAMVEATKGCAIYNRTPIAISKRCLDNYCMQSEYLYACKEAPKG
jgi:hypothetical protein